MNITREFNDCGKDTYIKPLEDPKMFRNTFPNPESIIEDKLKHKPDFTEVTIPIKFGIIKNFLKKLLK